MKTIIVEDEYHIRQGIKESIEWEALSAELIGEADNGEDAWELYKACQADVILLDINMPKMNGLELAKRIRAINDKAQIIFLTGFDEFNYVKQAILLNASDYLLKPISYQELKNALIQARNRFNKLKEQESMVEELKQTSKEQLILNLLQKRESPDDIIKRLGQIGVSFKEENYVVTCLELDLFEEPPRTLNQFQLFRSHIQELVRPLGGYLVADGENRLIWVWRFQKDIMMKTIKQLQQSIQNTMAVPVTIGLCETIGSVSDLPAGYRESRMAAEFKYYIGPGQVIPYHITHQSIETSRPLFTKELELLSKVKTGMDIEESFKGWMEELTLNNMDEAKMVASQFCVSLFRIIQEEELHLENGSNLSPFITLSQCTTLRELTVFLSNMLKKVAFMIKEKKEMQGNKIIENAKRWIRNHLSEDVSLVRISDHLHLSPNYFSQLFKQETGETFISYTTTQRFERSKELLRDNRLKISEIANHVGYTDSNYFSIAFRKFYGLTPSEYRKRL